MVDLIVDEHPGATDLSLNTLERTVRVFGREHTRGRPIEIYELHEPDGSGRITRIGFYLKSPNVEAIIGHSFWVPENMRYAKLKPSEEGTGVRGYQKAIALMYRYLNHQPRKVVEVDSNLVRRLLLNPPSSAEVISSLNVVDVLAENSGVNTRILRDLGTGHDFSFIVLDTETEFQPPVINDNTFIAMNDIGKWQEKERDRRERLEEQRLKNKKQEFRLGCTWDFYHGTRSWEKSQVVDLIKECNSFDKVVTYNGKAFDLKKVLRQYASQHVKEILEEKSVDVYCMIRDSCPMPRKKGELTLANVAFATLGLCKWEVAYGPEMEDRRKPIDDGLIDHCARDVEMTRDLFFYIMDNHYVYRISRSALFHGKVLEKIEIEDVEFWRVMSTPYQTIPFTVKELDDGL